MSIRMIISVLQLFNPLDGYKKELAANNIPLLSPERQRCVRPIRSGRENKRTLSLVVRQDYVKERLVNQVLDGIRTIIRPDLYEWALKQVRVRL